MRFIFRMSIILIAVTTLLGCTSCSDDNDKASVVGFWRLTNESSNDIYWEVKESGEVYAITQYKVTYENIKITYTIMFDMDMKLAGLSMEPLK